MIKRNFSMGFRILIGLVFIGTGVKYFIDQDFLAVFIALAAGAAFLLSLFLLKDGEKR